MSRYTFTCEHFDYNDFNGEEQNVASKHTTQFRADDLTTMLENFEMFLRGSGFHFKGKLDFFDDEEWDNSDEEENDFESETIRERVMNHIVKDLLQKNEKVEDEYGDIFAKNEEKCELCKLPVDVMQIHQCFDPKCPCGAYRNQYAD
jgi:hypothetical protein